MAVTGDALEAMGTMPFVREVNEVREALETSPRDRDLLLPVIQQRGSLRCFGGQVLMTTHAQLHGRDAGGGRLFGKPMAIETIDLESPGVQLMAEAQGLRIRADQIGASLGIEQSNRGGQGRCHAQQGGRDPSRFGHGYCRARAPSRTAVVQNTGP